VISALINPIAPRRRAGALLLLAVTLCSSGCGSSDQNGWSGVQGTAKEQKVEDLYRYEGTGKAKRKTRIRRETERFKELLEADKKNG
jgi:hypothetical protein